MAMLNNQRVWIITYYQWPFQAIPGIQIGGADSIYFWPIFEAYVRRYTPHKAKNMVLTYLHFRIMESPLI